MLLIDCSIFLTASFILWESLPATAERPNSIDAALTYASQHLLSGLDKRANPCQNFFNFTCGSWENNFAPTRYDVHDQTSIQKLHISKLIDQILKYYHKRKQTSNYIEWTITFYDQCMSEQVVSRLHKIDVILNHISKIAPLPSILQSMRPKNAARFSVWELLGKLQKTFAIPLLFEVDIDTAPMQCNRGKYVLKLSPPSKNATVIDSEFVKKIMQELGEMRNITIDANQLDRNIKAMMNFSADLQNLIEKADNAITLNLSSVADSENKDTSVYYEQSIEEEEDGMDDVIAFLKKHRESKEILSYDELANMHPKSKWSEYFRGLFDHGRFKIWNITNAFFAVKNKQYFQELQNILDNHSSETIFNYAFFTIADANYAVANGEETEDSNKTSHNLECVELVREHFKSAILRMIFDYQGYEIMEWRTDLEIMFEMIRSAFKLIISSADWLENDEKMNVIAKANAIRFHSGIPAWLNNDTEVNRRTNEFDAQKTITENTLNIGTKISNSKLDQVIHDTTDKDDEPNFEVNASYDDLIVHMGTGLILLPAYHRNYPLALKYEFIGWVMGHEFFHASDENRLDEAGFKHPLLKNPSRIAFNRRTSCLKKQLYSYCFMQKRK